MNFKKILKNLVISILLLTSFSEVSNATLEISRENLLIEYLFENWVIDTSWNNKILEATNINTERNSKINLDYGVLSWTSEIKTNLWWSTWWFWKYTISFWIKKDLMGKNKKEVFLSTNKWDIFSIKSDYNVQNVNCEAFWWSFSCKNMLDNKWHNIVIRKNWKYNKVYIDWNKMIDIRWSYWSMW